MVIQAIDSDGALKLADVLFREDFTVRVQPHSLQKLLLMLALLMSQ